MENKRSNAKAFALGFVLMSITLGAIAGCTTVIIDAKQAQLERNKVK